jgi:hypothetical protein
MCGCSNYGDWRSCIPSPDWSQHAQQLRRSHNGGLMPRQNYHQARKQRELARKARQQEKQQRRATRPGASGEDGPTGPTVGAGRESTTGSGK